MLGSSMAIVATGPRPGKTPISVPRTEPPKAYKRFCSVNATLKPSARLFNRSMSASQRARNDGHSGIVRFRP